jgi:hypothetical protein
MRFELIFERNTAYASEISNVRDINFLQNSSIPVKGRSTISLVRKLSMLEAEVLAHCLAVRNELAC